jgi:hypothetical protein
MIRRPSQGYPNRPGNSGLSRWGMVSLIAILAAGAPGTRAQSPLPPAQTQPAQTEAPPAPAPPSGTVIFSRELSPDPDVPVETPPPTTQNQTASGENDPLKVTDTERRALTFTAYDLDVHLAPLSAGISARAALTLRNDSLAPLNRLVLQITSSMHWDSFSTPNLAAAGSTTASLRLDFKGRRIATDADHTGWAQEAVVTLPQPLAPGASISLTTLYSGAIPRSAERLERIGAPTGEAAGADWDAVSISSLDSPGGGTALRGFGNVLWYPVASPPFFLGDGAKLFQAIARTRMQQAPATVGLRLTVEFVGDPPDAAFFCGRRKQLTVLRDNADAPIAESPGVATAVFDPQPLGFRSPSLFVTGHPASSTGTAANEGLIAAVTDHYDALPTYSAAAALVEPLLADWFGPHPLAALNILDHPGQPFEDDTLLVKPLTVQDASALAPSLTHSLTHAWIHSSYSWIDEGLAQFAGLLWTERSSGSASTL